jgi:hypothetical protein
MTVLGKIIKIFYCTMVFIKLLCQEVLVVFSRIGKHIERCLQTISMTQSYYEPIQYDLDGKRFTVLEKIIVISFRI